MKGFLEFDDFYSLNILITADFKLPAFYLQGTEL